MKLAHLLRCWRRINDVTSRQAAAQIGIGLSTYSRIENGKGMDGRALAKVINWMLGPVDETNKKSKERKG